jgi:glutathione S-transferase
MEPTLIYGHPLGSSMGLVAALEWLGQPYRATRVDLFTEIHTDAYRKILNGRGEAPVLITDKGEPLTETIAIGLWLEARDQERRISFAPGSRQADLMHQYMAFLNTGFTQAFAGYWMAMESKDVDQQDLEAWRRLAHRLVNDRHAKLEAMIGETPYLLGDKPTLADAVFVGVARWADFHQAIDPAAYPKIAALKARLHADPAVRFAVALEDGETPPGSGALKGHVPLDQLLAPVAA